MSHNVTVTRKEAEYLVFMYRKQIEEREKLTTTIISRTFNITAATVTETFHKLSEKSLVEYKPYYGVKLTKKGIVEAEKLLRKHRLLETLFVRFMKYNPIEACNEAAKIDYYCSEVLANNICYMYKHPVQCPCNRQIYSDPNCGREKQT